MVEAPDRFSDVILCVLLSMEAFVGFFAHPRLLLLQHMGAGTPLSGAWFPLIFT